MPVLTPARCRVFGLHVSLNRPISGLPSCADDAEGVDVCIDVDEKLPGWIEGIERREPWYFSSRLDETGAPLLAIWTLNGGTHVHAVFAEDFEFVVDRIGARVWVRVPRHVQRHAIESFLLGPVAAFLLLLRDTICLHASAVSFGQHAVAFVGPSGSGKSTIAAALAARGCAVLTDDLVTLSDAGTGRFLVHPGFPWLRLRPESVALLTGLSAAEPVLSRTDDGAFVDLRLNGADWRHEHRRFPLSCVYIVDAGGSPADAAAIRQAGAADALMTLVANTWTARVGDGENGAAAFDVLARVARDATLRRVSPAPDARALQRLVDAIVADQMALDTEPPIGPMNGEGV